MLIDIYWLVYAERKLVWEKLEPLANFNSKKFFTLHFQLVMGRESTKNRRSDMGSYIPLSWWGGPGPKGCLVLRLSPPPRLILFCSNFLLIEFLVELNWLANDLTSKMSQRSLCCFLKVVGVHDLPSPFRSKSVMAFFSSGYFSWSRLHLNFTSASGIFPFGKTLFNRLYKIVFMRRR